MGYDATITSLISLLALHVLLDGSVLHLLVPQLVLEEVKSPTLCGVVTFGYVISSGTRSCVSPLPAFLGGYWRLLEFTRVYWSLLEFTTVYRKLLEIHPHFYPMQCW